MKSQGYLLSTRHGSSCFPVLSPLLLLAPLWGVCENLQAPEVLPEEGLSHSHTVNGRQTWELPCSENAGTRTGTPLIPLAFQWRISRPYQRLFGHRGLSTSYSSLFSDGGPSCHVEPFHLPQGGSAAPGGGHAEVHPIRTSLHFFDISISPCLPHSCRKCFG